MMTKAPKEIAIPGLLAKWELVPANRLALTMAAATITIEEGREWDVTTAIPGLAVFVNTDLDHPEPMEHGGKQRARYVLNAAALCEQLVRDLLEPETPAEDEASEGHANHWNEDVEFSAGDWRYEVGNGDTRLGYHAWVRGKREASDGDD